MPVDLESSNVASILAPVPEATPARDEPGRASSSFRALSGAKTPLSSEQAASQLAQAWQGVTGRPPSVSVLGLLWAQWALETGRGASMHGYNFGGLKGVAPGGSSSSLWTREGHGPTEQRVRSRFRTYASAADGAADYVRTLADRYPRAFAAAASGDPSAFVSELSASGYFTADPHEYRAAVVDLWREFQAPTRHRMVAGEVSAAQQAVIWMLGRAIEHRGE